PAVAFAPVFSSVTGFDGVNETIPVTPGGGVGAAKIRSEATLTASVTPLSQNVIAGNNYSQAVSVSNAGPSDAVGVHVTVTPPTGLATSPASAPAGCVGSGGPPFTS